MLKNLSTHNRRISAFLLVLAPLVVACDGNPLEVEPSISASESSIFLDVGQTRQLDVFRTPGNAVFEANSDDPAVATVTQTSSRIAIAGVCEGFATVVLTMPAHPGIEFQITVEVEDDLIEPTVC